MMRFRTAVLTLALLGVGALSAQAQVERHRWQVVAGGGWQTFAGDAAMNGGGSIGGEANYFLNESFGLGLYADFTFAETAGDELIPAALNFVDSTTFTFVNQGVEVFQYGGQAKFRLPGATSPFVLAGLGGYTVFFDPQQNSDDANSTRWMMKFGVGVDFAVSGGAGFQLAVHDNFYPNWRATSLLPVRPQNQNTRFPELNPAPQCDFEAGESSCSVHNLRFSLSVVLVPGAL